MDSDVSRVLILGGGGNRGYAQSRWLRKWKSVYGINQPLYQIFGTIACTSIGAINGACIGLDKSFDEIESLFLSKAKRIFTSRTASERTLFSHNASKDSYVVTDAEKLLLLINNEPFYQSPYVDSDFGHNILYSLLSTNFGETTLEDLKTNIIIPARNVTQNTYVKFSNYPHSEYFAPKTKIKDALKATSAAPTYFPRYEINNNDYKDANGIYEDGGVHLNLPIEQGLTAAKIIKPSAKKIRILVLATGEEKQFIQSTATITDSMSEIEKKEVNAEHAISRLIGLYSASSTGAQVEAIKNLELLCRYTTDDIVCYCFDPLLDQKLTFKNNDIPYTNYTPASVTLDNSAPEFSGYLDAHVENDFNINASKIAIFTSKLLQ